MAKRKNQCEKFQDTWEETYTETDTTYSETYTIHDQMSNEAEDVAAYDADGKYDD
jgi:hypothetical protein